MLDARKLWKYTATVACAVEKFFFFFQVAEQIRIQWQFFTEAHYFETVHILFKVNVRHDEQLALKRLTSIVSMPLELF